MDIIKLDRRGGVTQEATQKSQCLIGLVAKLFGSIFSFVTIVILGVVKPIVS